MKFSEKLYSNVEPIWKEISNKEFITAMAEGTLDIDCYYEYLIQDSLYLPEYTDLLIKTKEYTNDKEALAFLDKLIDDSYIELEAVHEAYASVAHSTIPPDSRMAPVIKDNIGYMQQQLKTHGFLAGFTALLQCSWIYAYIAQTMKAKYGDLIYKSPYKDWFEVYCSPAYLEANQAYIDAVDRATQDISPDKEDVLIEIFKTCADYDARFRDYLWNMHLVPVS